MTSSVYFNHQPILASNSMGNQESDDTFKEVLMKLCALTLSVGNESVVLDSKEDDENVVDDPSNSISDMAIEKRMNELGLKRAKDAHTALGSLHRFVWRCLTNDKDTVARSSNAILSNSLPSQLFLRANIHSKMRLTEVRRSRLNSLAMVLNETEASMRRRLGLRMASGPLGEDEMIVCQLARIIEIVEHGANNATRHNDTMIEVWQESWKSLLQRLSLSQSSSSTEDVTDGHRGDTEWIAELEERLKNVLSPGSAFHRLHLCQQLKSFVYDWCVASMPVIKKDIALDDDEATRKMREFGLALPLTQGSTVQGSLMRCIFSTFAGRRQKFRMQYLNAVSSSAVWRKLAAPVFERFHHIKSRTYDWDALGRELTLKLMETENTLRRQWNLRPVNHDTLMGEEDLVLGQLAELAKTFQMPKFSPWKNGRRSSTVQTWRVNFETRFVPASSKAPPLLDMVDKMLQPDGFDLVHQALNVIDTMIESAIRCSHHASVSVPASSTSTTIPTERELVTETPSSNSSSKETEQNVTQVSPVEWLPLTSTCEPVSSTSMEISPFLRSLPIYYPMIATHNNTMQSEPLDLSCRSPTTDTGSLKRKLSDSEETTKQAKHTLLADVKMSSKMPPKRKWLIRYETEGYK